MLSKKLSRLETVAIATTLMTTVSSFLWHYSIITTFYSAYYTLVIASWYFFLKLLEKDTDNSQHWLPTVILYSFFTVLAMYTHASAFFFVGFQAIYFFWIRKQLSSPQQKQLLIIGGILLVSITPFLWVISQPWHLSHHMPTGYPVAPLWSVITAPINFLFLGYDIREFHEFPHLGSMIFYSIFGFFLLFKGIQSVQKYENQNLAILFCIGILPPVSIYLVSVLLQSGIFQFRTLLYAIFPLYYLIASYFSKQFSKKIFSIVLVLFVTFLYFLPDRRPYWPDTGRLIAQNVKKDFKDGDGILFYPGWMSLVFLRYFDPPAFGLSEHEQHFDPNKETYYAMVQRIDKRYFMVSGDDYLKHSDVKKAYTQFEKEHHRIWVLAGFTPELAELFSCQNEYMMMLPNGQFTPQQCVRKP